MTANLLEEPADGVKAINVDSNFEKSYTALLKREEMIEAGLLNPQSPWTKWTSADGECSYCSDGKDSC